MRDSQVMAMQQANVRRESLLFQQFDFLRMRQEAFERVWNSSTIWSRIVWMFKPASLISTVDSVQRILMEKERKEAAAQAAKPNIKVVSCV